MCKSQSVVGEICDQDAFCAFCKGCLGGYIPDGAGSDDGDIHSLDTPAPSDGMYADCCRFHGCCERGGDICRNLLDQIGADGEIFTCGAGRLAADHV